MQYVGGKTRIGRRIAGVIRAVAENRNGVVVEPFCGALGVTMQLTGLKVVPSDACKPLITLYQAVQRGWKPPFEITREQWAACKEHQDPDDPMTAFCGFGCSYGGSWFQGFTEWRTTGTPGLSDYRDEPAAALAARALIKRLSKLRGVQFTCRDYANTPLLGTVYADPPYAGTTGYAAVGDFDHERFWEWARYVSKNTVVLISEATAPDDFVPVYAVTATNGMTMTTNTTRRLEYVFAHESRAANVKYALRAGGGVACTAGA